MKKIIFLLSIAIITFSACNMGKKGNNAESNNTEVPDPAHNSRNSVDWAGVYKGSIPCADCEGIEVELRLNEDLTYKKVMTYLGKGQDNRFEEKGTFEWDEDGGRIKLTDSASPETQNNWFKVGENLLIMLDIEGNPIESNLPAEAYEFKKIDLDYVVTEKYWKLTELNGKAITPPEAGSREAHFILKEKDNKVIGNTGCNNLNGGYTLSAETENGIQFTPMATTRMACVGVDYEQEYLKVFEDCDSYSVQNDTLTLSKGETPLAKFVVVYLR